MQRRSQICFFLKLRNTRQVIIFAKRTLNRKDSVERENPACETNLLHLLIDSLPKT